MAPLIPTVIPTQTRREPSTLYLPPNLTARWFAVRRSLTPRRRRRTGRGPAEPSPRSTYLVPVPGVDGARHGSANSSKSAWGCPEIGMFRVPCTYPMSFVLKGRYDATQMAPSEAERLAGLPTPHGTSAGYNVGCRCESCRAANAARARARRARHRALGAGQGPEGVLPPAIEPLLVEVAPERAPVAGPEGVEEAVHLSEPESPTDIGWGEALAVVGLVVLLALAMWALRRRGGGGEGDGHLPWPRPGPGGFY